MLLQLWKKITGVIAIMVKITDFNAIMSKDYDFVNECIDTLITSVNVIQ